MASPVSNGARGVRVTRHLLALTLALVLVGVGLVGGLGEVPPAEATSRIHISVGYYFACAINFDDTVSCWGTNQSLFPDGPMVVETPRQVEGITGVTNLSVGSSNAPAGPCAVAR